MLSKRSVLDLAKSMKGVAVMATLPGSPAHQAGLRYGDIVLAVNGQATASWADYLAAKDCRADGMNVVFLRAGNVIEVDLTYRADAKADPIALVAELATQRLFASGDDDDPSDVLATKPRRRAAS